MRKILFIGLILIVCSSCTPLAWKRPQLSESAREVKISKNEPSDACEMIGTFDVYNDCVRGFFFTGNVNQDVQYECIQWKTDSLGGNYAVIDAANAIGIYQGRIFKCPR